METSIPDLNQTEYEATEYEAPAGTIPAMQNILSSDSLVLLIVILNIQCHCDSNDYGDFISKMQ